MYHGNAHSVCGAHFVVLYSLLLPLVRSPSLWAFVLLLLPSSGGMPNPGPVSCMIKLAAGSSLSPMVDFALHILYDEDACSECLGVGDLCPRCSDLPEEISKRQRLLQAIFVGPTLGLGVLAEFSQFQHDPLIEMGTLPVIGFENTV